MTDDGLVECRLCGRRWRSLGHHLRKGHGIDADEYRDRFGIRRGEPLTSPATRARMSDAIGRTIAAGKLDGHYAGNAARASDAGAAGDLAKRRLRAAGVEFPHGTPRTLRRHIRLIVEAVEAGAGVATAVKASPISYTTLHAGLKRHPDLKARVEAAKRAGPGAPGPHFTSRETARTLGMTRYVTGRPCSAGHVAERLVSSGECCECHRLGQHRRGTAAHEGRRGCRVAPGSPTGPIPLDPVLRALAAIEAGETVEVACTRHGISDSTYYGRLQRHSTLRDRHKAAMQGRARVRPV